MEKGYAGRIGQTGRQEVKAPARITPKKGSGKVKRGDDLRKGKK